MSLLRKITNKAEDGFDKAKKKIKDELGLFDKIIIYPYRGYGNGSEAQLHGRILEKERIIHEDHDLEDTFWRNLRKLWKRYESDEIPGVGVEGELNGEKAHTVSDGEGYFILRFENLEKKKLADGWHDVQLRIKNMPFNVDYEEFATGSILISNQENSFGIISDVDDTIIQTNAMNTIKKVRIMLTKNAKTRIAFDGVDELYAGLTANGRNPLFFISGSSYNLYDMLVTFCNYHNIQKAPFILRDLGLTPHQWLKQDTSEYKKGHINHILSFFDRLSFILIGDSGQHDPEIYSDIHRNNPGRIKAIYIRHVSSDKRKEELEKMSGQLDIPFLHISDSREALTHAKKMAWIERTSSG